MQGLNKNRLALLIAIVAMMVIAACFGYRLQLGAHGLVFERNISSLQ
jgi:lipopolysaccharide export LptBFGC system permease protein LptF